MVCVEVLPPIDRNLFDGVVGKTVDDMGNCGSKLRMPHGDKWYFLLFSKLLEGSEMFRRLGRRLFDDDSIPSFKCNSCDVVMMS